MNRILRSIEELVGEQKCMARVFQGVYLSPDEIEQCANELEKDSRFIDAVGLYTGVPIYDRSRFSELSVEPPLKVEELNGMEFAYIQMRDVF